MKKLQVHLVLALMVLLNGCSFLGIDFTEDRTIAIQKSPYIVIVDGDLTSRDLKSVDRILALLSTQPYTEANNSNFQVHINDQREITKTDTITNTTGNVKAGG